MAESSSQEKTEEATPRQLQKARERGDVAHSKDFTSAVLLSVSALFLGYQLSGYGDVFQSSMLQLIDAISEGNTSKTDILTFLSTMANDAALVLLPLLLILFVFGLLAPFLQVGVVLSVDPLKPKLERLNPVAGLKRVFFSMQSYVEFLKSVIKVVVLGWLSWKVIEADMPMIARMGDQPILVSAKQMLGTIGRLVAWSIVFFFALAVLDILYQRFQYMKKLRMTKQQVKEEFKETEGDPHFKAERQRVHEDVMNNMMFIETREADVVVVNPTHVACALRYRPETGAAPRVVAKGQGAIAKEIRRIAKEEDVEIVRDVSLARTLHELQLNEEVPEDLYEAVAEVLLWVERLARFRGEIVPWRTEKNATADDEER